MTNISKVRMKKQDITYHIYGQLDYFTSYLHYVDIKKGYITPIK